MRRILVLCALLLALVPGEGHAQDGCYDWAFRQHDMAGVYQSIHDQMRVTVYPCGGVDVLWSNPFGTHRASYYGVERLPGGGVIARIALPDPSVGSLDGRDVVGLKPAEAGWIQAITMGPFGDNMRVYRLRKIG
jgi:hypothetical protein